MVIFLSQVSKHVGFVLSFSCIFLIKDFLSFFSTSSVFDFYIHLSSCVCNETVEEENNMVLFKSLRICYFIFIFDGIMEQTFD